MPVHALASIFAAAVRLFLVTRSGARILADAGTEPESPQTPDTPERTQHRHLARCLASVILDVARQDGEVDPQELDGAVELVETQLGAPPEDSKALQRLFRDVAMRAVPLEQACLTLTVWMRDEEREHLIAGLYSLCAVDGELHRAERARVRKISELLSVPPRRRRTALVRALGSVALCYELLDVSPRASNEELAAAFTRREAELAGDEDDLAHLKAAWEELRQLRGIT